MREDCFVATKEKRLGLKKSPPDGTCLRLHSIAVALSSGGMQLE